MDHSVASAVPLFSSQRTRRLPHRPLRPSSASRRRLSGGRCLEGPAKVWPYFLRVLPGETSCTASERPPRGFALRRRRQTRRGARVGASSARRLSSRTQRHRRRRGDATSAASGWLRPSLRSGSRRKPLQKANPTPPLVRNDDPVPVDRSFDDAFAALALETLQHEATRTSAQRNERLLTATRSTDTAERNTPPSEQQARRIRRGRTRIEERPSRKSTAN